MTDGTSPVRATQAAAGPYQGETINVIDQAVSVLKDVCGSAEPRGVRELSRDLGYSKSTVQRILTSFLAAGLVSADEVTRKYSVGAGALTLAWQFANNNNLIGASAALVDRLAAETGETVSVSTLTGNRRVTVYEAESPNQLRLTTGVGRPHSLLTGATSQVLLSLLTAEERIAALERAVGDRTEGGDSDFDLENLLSRVKIAEADGYAVSHGEWIEGAVGLSVPIGRHGNDLATLSIYGPAFRLERDVIDDFIGKIRETAAAIALAWRG